MNGLTGFPTPPYFEDTQVMSASGHLNGLLASAQYLLGLYQAQGLGWLQGKGPFWLRQRSTTLTYSVYAFAPTAYGYGTANRRVRIWYDDTLLAEHALSTGGWHTVTSSASTAAFATGEFHRITVRNTGEDGDGDEVDNDFSVLYLRETLTPSIAALPAFATGTPSAADWNALSEAAADVYDAMFIPLAANPATYVKRGAGDTRTYTVTHRSDTLFYTVRYRPAFNGDQGGSSGNPDEDLPDWSGRSKFSVWLKFTADGADYYIGGQTYMHGDVTEATAAETTIQMQDAGPLAAGRIVLTDSGEQILLGTKAGDTFTGCTRGHNGTTAKALPRYANFYWWFPGAKQERTDWPWLYAGTCDLQALGLTAGQDYQVVFEIEDINHGDTEEAKCEAWVVAVGEAPDDYSAPDWWAKVDPWEHGDTVNGTAGVKVVRDNLTNLIARLALYNAAAMTGNMGAGAIVHQHAWLHYRCDVQGDGKLGPSLAYTAFGKREEVSLKFEPNKWLSHYLGGQKGLFPGTLLEFHDVTYAFEDATS